MLLEPQRGSPPDDAIWTDGSVGTSGGAAAVQVQSQAQALVHVSLPRSSTQCELVALGLTSGFASPPSVILTDSLCSLQLIRSWGKRSTASVLLSLDRAEVRAFLYKWQGCPHPPKLEKVKAHDEAGRLAGKLKTLGNDLADSLAEKAAEGAAQLFSPSECFSDAVQLRDPNNHWVVDLSVIETQWWALQRSSGARRRQWLFQLYPATVEFDWPGSVGVFRPPTVVDGHFVYSAPPSVLKWTARARTGALATRCRLLKNTLVESAQCPCCPCPEEDDVHILTECTTTGSADCATLAPQLWLQAGHARHVPVQPLSLVWVQAHILQLAVGLLPRGLGQFLPPEKDQAARGLFRDFHLKLVGRLAEVLRRRQVLISTTSTLRTVPQQGGSSSSMRVRSSAHLAPSRCLTVADLRRAESQPAAPSELSPVRFSYRGARAASLEAALSLGLWVKRHPHLHPAPVADGEPSVALLLLWEADHKEMFPSRSTELKPRLGAFAKRLVTAVAADPELVQWLESRTFHIQLCPGLPWNRYLKWAVRIDSAVGEPFLGSWKSYLVGCAVRPPLPLCVDEMAPPAKKQKVPQGTKRKLDEAPRPPSSTKRARLERLQAAQASGTATSALESPLLTTSSLLSCREGSLSAGVPSRAGTASPGAIP